MVRDRRPWVLQLVLMPVLELPIPRQGRPPIVTAPPQESVKTELLRSQINPN